MAKKKSWIDKSLETLVAKNPELSGKTILKNALPQKMSEVLLGFAKPLLDDIDVTDKRVLKATLQVAVVIWNYLVAKKVNTPSSRSLLAGLAPRIEQGFSDPIGREVFRVLSERKESVYPDVLMMIQDFDLIWDSVGSEFHVTVVSANP